MSYRAPRGDAQDVAQGVQRAVGFFTNPVGATLDFLGGQVLGSLFGESPQDRSIRLWKQWMQAHQIWTLGSLQTVLRRRGLRSAQILPIIRLLTRKRSR